MYYSTAIDWRVKDTTPTSQGQQERRKPGLTRQDPEWADGKNSVIQTMTEEKALENSRTGKSSQGGGSRGKDCVFWRNVVSPIQTGNGEVYLLEAPSSLPE